MVTGPPSLSPDISTLQLSRSRMRARLEISAVTVFKVLQPGLSIWPCREYSVSVKVKGWKFERRLLTSRTVSALGPASYSASPDSPLSLHNASYMTSYRRSISLEMPIHNTARMLYFPELPLFPSSKAAIEEYLDTRLSDSTCIGSFFGLAPDYRGRIWKVKLSTKGVQATIQCPFGSDAADLAAKVYASKSRAVRLNTAIHRSLTE